MGAERRVLCRPSLSLWISFIVVSHFGIYLPISHISCSRSIPLEKGFSHQVAVSCWAQFSPHGRISSAVQASSLSFDFIMRACYPKTA